MVELREFFKGQIVFGFEKSEDAVVMFGRYVATATRSFFWSEVRVKLREFAQSPNSRTADLKSDSNLGLVAGGFDSRYDPFS